MQVIIAGAGRVGTRVAEELEGDHEVMVVDVDKERTDGLSYELDILPVNGDATAVETLREAGIEGADLLIASTDSDEINIITCGTAKALSDVRTVARVKQSTYLTTWDQAENAFGVDFMVGTNLLTVGGAIGGTGLAAARNFDVFAGGTVQMAEFEIDEDSSIVDQTVSEADTIDSLTFAALLTDEGPVVPTGSSTIEPGDNIVVIGKPDSVHEFGALVRPGSTDVENVLIVGGSDVGYQTARLLEDRGLSPQLIEADADRARLLAERLPRTKVRNRDPTDRQFLENERLEEVDVVVAALSGDSEKNLLAALLAKRFGAGRSVAIVDHGEYVQLFEDVGVDVAVNPRRATAQEIVQYVRDEDTQHVAHLENDRAEVIEIRIDENSVLAGQTIRSGIEDLPEGVVVGAITRNGSFVMPRGETVVQPNDHVVVFAESSVVKETLDRL